ncbi:hypothetical protein Ddc_15441 [Ditylenchus destructor]|nr:hypothetical protein Ddc_15441 [Ditylenchus destructor]
MLYGMVISVLIGMLLFSISEVDATETDEQIVRRLHGMHGCDESVYCRLIVSFYVKWQDEQNIFFKEIASNLRGELFHSYSFLEEDLVRQ